MAHEIGHNMGMAHDFDQTKGNSEDPRFDSKGKKCTGLGGIMDYGIEKKIWYLLSFKNSVLNQNSCLQIG